MIEINGMKMYDTDEMTALFNISPSTLAKLRSSGRLRYARIGRKKYTSEDSIRDYLNGLIAPVKR